MTPIDIREPAILIRNRKLYKNRMSSHALYEATRGVWRMSDDRQKAQFAFVVHDGIIREVYAIHQWHEAGSTKYTTRPVKDVQIDGRWEFTGKLAPEPMRERYIGKSVAHYFERGASNPIRYVNI